MFFYPSIFRWLGLHGLMYPSVIANAKRASSKNVQGNYKGEGRLLGGLLVIGKGDTGILFEHREKVFGDHASIEDILSACKKAVGQTDSTAAQQTSDIAAKTVPTPRVCPAEVKAH